MRQNDAGISSMRYEELSGKRWEGHKQCVVRTVNAVAVNIKPRKNLGHWL
jgi:hypothetical protein